MFWRFGFQNGSAIDSLLDKEDVSLEAILDEDDLLQECKSQNNRLIDYFERVDVLQKLFGYVTGRIESEKGHFKYPYIATEVLCCDIWSIVESCVNERRQLLVPFWETVLDRSPDDMKTQMTMASYFVKINSVFMNKKPAEMLAFMQSQPFVVDKLLLHIETPSFVELLGRIIQLDEHIPNSNVLEWLSSQNLVGRLIQLLSPNHTPSIHNVVTDLIKNIISMATPSPGAAGLTEGMQNGPASNRFARELASRENIEALASYMLTEFSEESCKTPTSEYDLNEEADGTLRQPTFDSCISSVVQSIAVVVELIRKNNSDYFEPYLFHTLRNRLIQVQQQSQLQGEDVREALEQVMSDMVNRMGVVNLGPLLQVISSKIQNLQKYLKAPRSMTGPIQSTIGVMTPFLLERYRIVELYAELLHCSNMSLLNRPASFARMYDSEGRLQGGLGGLEELAQVIAQNSGNEPDVDNMDDSMTEISPALDFPVRGASDDSTSLDSDDIMTDSDQEPNSSDDEAMEEIAMYDDPTGLDSSILSPPGQQSPLRTSPSPIAQNTNDATNNDNAMPPSPSSETSAGTSRSGGRPQGSRRSSRSRRRTTIESSVETLLPIGEQLKRSLLQENVISTMIDLFFQFPWNNFLHSAVYDIVHQVMTGNVDHGYNRELVIALFRDARILHRIIEGQATNDRACAKPKGIRLGYMGHLMLISEDVITAMARFPPDLRVIIIQHAPEPQWDEYVTGRYNEAKQEDNKLLGGGKPSVNTPARTASQWRVDEDDLTSATAATTASSSETKGEFRRASSVGPTVRNTADFGPAPVDDEDEDNITSGRAPHFARYLSSEINPSDHFGPSSSDDDDEEEGWLTQSTFGMGNTSLAARSLSERRPLSASGFDDAFDPTDPASMVHDPFTSHEDDGFGPFSDTAGSVGESFTFSSSFSDEESSFESFGDFGDFQSADELHETTPTTPTTGSWTFASEGGDSLTSSVLSGSDFGVGSSGSNGTLGIGGSTVNGSTPSSSMKTV